MMLEDYRTKRTPTSRHIIAAAIVLIVIEAALILADSYIVDYNTRLLGGIVDVMGFLIIVILTGKLKMTAEKPKLPFAAKCIENLHFSPEELQQFDTEIRRNIETSVRCVPAKQSVAFQVYQCLIK